MTRIEWEFNQDLQSVEGFFIQDESDLQSVVCIRFPGLEAKDHLEALKSILGK